MTSIRDPIENARGPQDAVEPGLREPSDDPVGGAAGNTPVPGAVQGKAAALFSREASGPLHVGHVNDKHRLGTTKDGEPINAGHIDANAYFYRDQVKDGPLYMEDSEYPGHAHFPLSGRVHCVFDGTLPHSFVGGQRQGMWRWYAEVPEVPVGGTPDPKTPTTPGEPDQPITPRDPVPGGPITPVPGGGAPPSDVITPGTGTEPDPAEGIDPGGGPSSDPGEPGPVITPTPGDGTGTSGEDSTTPDAGTPEHWGPGTAPGGGTSAGPTGTATGGPTDGGWSQPGAGAGPAAGNPLPSGGGYPTDNPPDVAVPPDSPPPPGANPTPPPGQPPAIGGGDDQPVGPEDLDDDVFRLPDKGPRIPSGGTGTVPEWIVDPATGQRLWWDPVTGTWRKRRRGGGSSGGTEPTQAGSPAGSGDTIP